MPSLLHPMPSSAPLRQQADPDPRWWIYVRQGRIVCPAGHHIPNTFHVTEAGFVRCGKRCQVARTGPWVECDRWVFLYAIRGGGIVVAEVTLDEKRAMEHLATPAEMLEYLQVWERGR